MTNVQDQKWYNYYYDESSSRFFFSIDEEVVCYGLIGFFDINEYIGLLNKKMGLDLKDVAQITKQSQQANYDDYIATDHTHYGKNLIMRLFTANAKKGLAQKISEQISEYLENMKAANKTRDIDGEFKKLTPYIYSFQLTKEHKKYLDDHESVPEEDLKINKFTVYKIDKTSVFGKGGQGVVYKCLVNNVVGDTSVENYESVAKMVVYKSSDEFHNNREAYMLKYITGKDNCSDVIKYIDSFCSPGNPEVFYIISELAKCKELVEMIKNGLTFEESIVVLEKLAKALKCLHSDFTVHRDVKPNNVIIAYNCENNIPESERKNMELLNERMKVKIIDLGLGCFSNNDAPQPDAKFKCDTEQVGTLPYFPPPVREEELENETVNNIAELHSNGDVASLGYIIIDLFYIPSVDDRDMMHRVFWSIENYNKHYKFRYPGNENLKGDVWSLATKMILKKTRKDILDMNSVLSEISKIKTKLKTGGVSGVSTEIPNKIPTSVVDGSADRLSSTALDGASLGILEGGYRKMYALNKINYRLL